MAVGERQEGLGRVSGREEARDPANCSTNRLRVTPPLCARHCANNCRGFGYPPRHKPLDFPTWLLGEDGLWLLSGTLEDR